MSTRWIALVLAAATALVGACNDPKSGSSESAKTQGETDTAAQAEATAQAEAKEREALKAGVEAAVYGLPLVIMDITKAKTTNVAKPEGFAAPVNQFVSVRAFPDASFKDVVRANVDTLYSSAFLDLAREPIVLSVPDTHGRYYLLPMLDAWTNIFGSPGKRTSGAKGSIPHRLRRQHRLRRELSKLPRSRIRKRNTHSHKEGEHVGRAEPPPARLGQGPGCGLFQLHR